MEKSKIESIIKEIEEAAKKIGESHGLEIRTAGGYHYTTNNFRFQIEAAVVNDEGVAETREVEDFKHLAFRFGFQPDDLHKELIIQGRTFRIVGLKPRNFKYPIICEELGTLKQYKLGADQVKEGLKERLKQ